MVYATALTLLPALMTNSAQVDRPSWKVNGVLVHADLADLMALTEAEEVCLAELHHVATDRAPALADAFYERLMAHRYTREYLQNYSMDALHGTIKSWFTDLFSGTYGADYVKHRLGIGYIHVKIGLPVRYPLAMLDVVQEHGETICQQSSNPEQAEKAFRKVLALDIAIFNQAYEDNQLKHLSELVGGERLARCLLTGL